MNEGTAAPKQSRSWRAILLAWLSILKRVLLFALLIAALVAASFLIKGSFSAQTFSDRLFLVGVIVMFIGVFIFITVGGSRRNLGIPSIARTEEDARYILDHSEELRNKAEKRYDAGSQVWGAGLACMILSILLYFLLSVFGI